ncbi:Hypothetical protein P9303_22551 [Prochlorococcus marinus str. MIT 9303]|uniref:Uncharacterized protein n=1 Tax=Prochlorococcus marinus (strain MIT 9303) TaxID=59922 RepID=A2CBY0_PROM3|nr:Hypothetical protein P9303_22551 [Prochlorococcus marinus str. MIT 9303]
MDTLGISTASRAIFLQSKRALAQDFFSCRYRLGKSLFVFKEPLKIQVCWLIRKAIATQCSLHGMWSVVIVLDRN